MSVWLLVWASVGWSGREVASQLIQGGGQGGKTVIVVGSDTVYVPRPSSCLTITELGIERGEG